MNQVHEHDLIIREYEEEDDERKKCAGCREVLPGPKFYWCTLCKSCFHERCAKLPREIKVFYHPCPLSLDTTPSFTCDSCSYNRRFRFHYRCARCYFDMCLDCSDQALFLTTSDAESVTEQIRHCCHHHPLQPLPVRPNCPSSCPVCNMSCSFGPTWGCEPCDFRIHKPCLDILPEMIQIKLPSEVATWILRISIDSACIDCSQASSSNIVFRRAGHKEGEYLCIFCCLVRIMIKKKASQVPKVINHFIHPCFNLKLEFSLPSSTCNACFLSQHNFSYHCKSCDFFLCFDCAQLPQFSHWHPLKLLTGAQDTISPYMCHLCEKICSESFYSCVELCRFYVHKSCVDSLPNKISQLLRSPTISLIHVLSFECATCNHHQNLGLAFYCSERKCKFCVQCVVQPESVVGDDGRFKSILHWHQLSICETRFEDKRRICFLCKEPCIPWCLCYECGECQLFFHKACAELPAQLEHPLHPDHHLTLTNRSSSSLSNVDMACRLCLKSLSQEFPLYDLVYRCQKCSFQLDTQCAALFPSVEYYIKHRHLLYVVVNMHGDTYCKVCYEPCKGSCTIRCAIKRCDFNLHLHCGPLPLKIKHRCHVHALVLKDYYVEDNGSDEFACHICEERRDPRLPVYCCSRSCLMICDIKCMLNEVIPLLRGECGEVELRTPFPQVSCRIINIKSDSVEGMLDTIIERASDEIQEADHVFKYDLLMLYFSDFDSEEEETFGIEILEKEENKSDVELGSEGGKEDESREEKDVDISDGKVGISLALEEAIGTDVNLDFEARNYSFSWKALSHFNKSLRTPSFEDLDKFLMRKYNGYNMSGAYSLPEILGPIYDEFFERYNIIDHNCHLNYFQRRYLVLVTCGVIHEMRIIKVVDVTKETIRQWLGWILFVQAKGNFNVGIVAQNIRQLWQAHYYIQSKKIVDDKTSLLERQLEQVSMYKAEQRTKIDELSFKVYEAEATHQELLLMDNEHTTYTVLGSRGPMKKVRNDALEIKWRSCYDASVMYPGNLPTR